jgi:DNA-binding GntR family transcriptional regulator
MSEKIVADKTLAARVTDKLREDIINKKFEAGSRITIKEIAERYGVSPMPVREAFRTLEGEKFLEINAYKGATVQRIDENFVRDVYGILRGLECVIYESALDEIDTGVIRQLRFLNEQIKAYSASPEFGQEYIDMNTLFHNTIMEHGKNTIALEQYYYYHGFIRTLRKRYFPKQERIRTVVGQHAALIDALESKDPLAIKKAVDIHVSSAMENFLTQFAQGD